MKAISLQLDDNIYADTENLVKTMNISRNRYINEALAYYNAFRERQELASEFKIASKIVSNSSKEILAEMELLEDGNEKI